jgi:hypothetical protein
MRNYATGVAILALAALAACGTDSDDLREIRQLQHELRAKLGDIEKTIDRLRPRALAEGRPPRVAEMPEQAVEGLIAAVRKVARTSTGCLVLDLDDV